MADESTLFGLATLGVIAGSSILIFGVLQNHGEELNAIMLAGGAVVLLATGLLSIGVGSIDAPEHH